MCLAFRIRSRTHLLSSPPLQLSGSQQREQLCSTHAVTSSNPIELKHSLLNKSNSAPTLEEQPTRTEGSRNKLPPKRCFVNVCRNYQSYIFCTACTTLLLALLLYCCYSQHSSWRSCMQTNRFAKISAELIAKSTTSVSVVKSIVEIVAVVVAPKKCTGS